MYAIVAVDEKWGIGRDNGLLFRLPADLKRFRSLTEGHTVLMGRKTLESLPGGRGLLHRRNIVLTGRRDFAAENCQIVHSPAEAVLSADEDTWVIGGESVYRAFLPLCSRVYVTRIAADGGADVFVTARTDAVKYVLLRWNAALGEPLRIPVSYTHLTLPTT